MLGLRHCPRCALERLLPSWLLIAFIEEHPDSQMYVEENIVSRNIAIALVFLKLA